MTQHQQERRGRALAGSALIAAVFLMTVVPPSVGLNVDWASFSAFALCALLFMPIILYARWRRMAMIRALIETTLLVLMLTVAVLVLSYCAMRLNYRLADDFLSATDAQIGLDASQIVAWVDARPRIAPVFQHAYASFGLQIILLPPLLVLLGHGDRAYRFAAGYFVLCTVSIGVSTIFPAIGAFSYRGASVEDFQVIDAHFGYHFLNSFHAVRDDPGFVLTLGAASGIVTFPSIHAGVAVLCGWAAWPHSLLRWPVLVLNIAMFCSAVTHGAHYVVDLIAGGGVALVVLVLVSRTAPWRVPTPFPFTRRAAPAGAAGARSA